VAVCFARCCFFFCLPMCAVLLCSLAHCMPVWPIAQPLDCFALHETPPGLQR
jgi:hypothetical protein